MKRLFHVLLILCLVGCDNPKSTDAVVDSSSEAEDIVNKSIEKHGGRTYWEKLESISYNKITLLFDSAGYEESGTVQKHTFILKPELKASIRWIENGDSIKIQFIDGEATRYINSKPVPGSNEASKNAVFAALYVLFQPFKLTDAGTTLRFIGIDSIDGRAVKMVKPVYDGFQPGDDEWLFYFDTGSNELIANLVNHNGRRSLIKNIAFDGSIPLYLHQHRKSYFVDSMMNIQYLRAEYFYTNYQLDFGEQR